VIPGFPLAFALRVNLGPVVHKVGDWRDEVAEPSLKRVEGGVVVEHDERHAGDDKEQDKQGSLPGTHRTHVNASTARCAPYRSNGPDSLTCAAQLPTAGKRSLIHV